MLFTIETEEDLGRDLGRVRAEIRLWRNKPDEGCLQVLVPDAEVEDGEDSTGRIVVLTDDQLNDLYRAAAALLRFSVDHRSTAAASSASRARTIRGRG